MISSSMKEEGASGFTWGGFIKVVESHTSKYGRPEYDMSHTLAAYQWGEWLSEELNLDSQKRDIVLAALLLHDQGYDFRGAKGDKVQLDAVREQKEEHLKRGGRLAKKLYGISPELRNKFNEEQWKEVIELIENHDKWDLLHEEKYPKLLGVIVAADTFGQIDLDKVRPSYEDIDLRKYYQGKLKERIDVIKEIFKDKPSIIEKADNLYDKLGEYKSEN